MNEILSKYCVDNEQMNEYLKKVFIYRSVYFIIIMAIVLTMFGYIVSKQDADFPVWIPFVFTFVICAGAFLYSLKLWADKLKALDRTEFILTFDSISQKTKNIVERDFKFSEIAIIKTNKVGTTIIQGNWFTKINYYLPKRTSNYQLGNATVIFIPTITTHYPELIDSIKQAKRLTT